jgi:hypothetical protein
VTWTWIVFAAGFPVLVSYYTFEKVLAVRGPSAFANPGGLKLPLGEVLLLASVLVSLWFVALIDAAVNL